MPYKTLVLTLFCLFSILAPIPVSAQQNTPVHYSEEHIENYKSNSDFDYTEVEKDTNWWNQLKEWVISFFQWLFQKLLGVDIVPNSTVLFIKTLFYSIIGFLVFLLIKLLLKVNLKTMKTTKSNMPSMQFSEDEHIIQNEDISQLIATAVANNNYRLAVRYYYLLILKTLTEEKFIEWQYQKTNNDYSKEIAVKELKAPFKALTNWYDFIWYGNFEIDTLQFDKIAVEFKEFQHKIKKIG